jgi:hypothetical protein
MEMKLKTKVVLSAVLGIAFSAWIVHASLIPHSCTIFTAVQGKTVLFGDNFDYHERDLVIGFYPPSAAGYGSVHFGYLVGSGPDAYPSYQRAVNDQGLAWAVNSIPRARLIPHPEKAYDYIEDEFLYTILKQAATVDDAVRIARMFDFGNVMIVQIHIADASGEAVVISPGRDGEIAFTRKPAGDGYLLSTNFNLAIPEKGPVDFRWDTATEKLDKLRASQTLTPEFAADILEAVHLRTLTTHTLHSNVIDLKNGEIYIYYMSQYNQVVKINIAGELALGQRVVETRSLFPAETSQVGDTSYQRFESRFRLVQAAVILICLVLLGCLIVLVPEKLFGCKLRQRVISGISL